MTRKTVFTLSISLFVTLLLWGIYTFIVYLGVVPHALVYMNQEQLTAVAQACGEQNYWCRGWETLPIFLKALFTTARPLWNYIIISLLAYGAFIGWRGFTRGHFILAYSIKPWQIVGGFVLAVWLIATMLSFGSLERGPDGRPFRQFFEPLPQVYTTAGPEALVALQENYQALLDKGCLTEIGKTSHGARVYNMKYHCMQISIFQRVGFQLLLIGLLLINFLIAGRLVFSSFRKKITHPLLEMTLSFGLGSFLWVAALWLIAVVGLFRPAVTIPLFVGFPIIAFPQTLYWLKSLVRREWSIDKEYSHIYVLLTWFLMSYLALNFLNVVRPFPIGWDDLGSYINRPRQLASYGTFIPDMATFQWEYITALAFAMFGEANPVGATMGMLANWSTGLLSVLAVYSLGRLFLGRRAGILSAILYYCLPMVGHFSFADMKIDNASFFTGVISILAVLVFLFGTPGTDEEHRIEPGQKWLLLVAGVLAGFCFGVKATGILTVIMTLSILGGALLGVVGFVSLALFGFALLYQFSPFDLSVIANKVGFAMTQDMGMVLQKVTVITLIIASIVLFAYAGYKKKDAIWQTITSFLFYGAGLLIAVLPWMAHNVTSHGHISSGSLLSYNNFLIPYISYLQEDEIPTDLDPRTPVRFLPPELELNPQDPACTISSRVEELDRYWGFGTGWGHYLGLPWRVVMNLDSVGYYVTLIPALLLFPLLLLLPYFWRKEARWLRLLFAGTAIFFVQWIFVANGISWYGIGMFLGFAIALETLVAKAPDNPNKIIAGVLLTASILICLINRMWQFDVQRNLFEYPLGKANMETIREATIPYYDNIRDSVLERHESMPDTPYTFRVGTFIAYFIPRNKEILPLADHQLQVFNCLNQERDHALTLQRFKALGFNSMIFDTNTATIESDPNGTLHQKVNAFLDFVNDASLGLQLPVNDSNAGIVYVLLP